MLLHDYGTSSRSIFALLQLKSKPFFTTANHLKVGNGHTVRILSTKTVEIKHGVADSESSQQLHRWEPRYFRAEQESRHDAAAKTRWRGLPFNGWWQEPIVLSTTHTVSREQLVHAMSNELAGTHSAEKIQPSTLALINGDLDYFKIAVGSPPGMRVIQVSDNTLADSLIRQMAYEVQRTVERHFPEMSARPIVALPLPRQYRLQNSSLRVFQPEAEVRQWLIEWERNDRNDLVLTHEVRSEVYWFDRRIELLSRGL